jgi:hypothetical protein
MKKLIVLLFICGMCYSQDSLIISKDSIYKWIAMPKRTVKFDTSFHPSTGAVWDYRKIKNDDEWVGKIEVWNGIIGIKVDTLIESHLTIFGNNTCKRLYDTTYNYYLDCVVDGQKKKFKLWELK